MVTDKEARVFKELTEAVEELGDSESITSEVIINAAGHMVGEGLMRESKQNKWSDE